MRSLAHTHTQIGLTQGRKDNASALNYYSQDLKFCFLLLFINHKAPSPTAASTTSMDMMTAAIVPPLSSPLPSLPSSLRLSLEETLGVLSLSVFFSFPGLEPSSLISVLLSSSEILRVRSGSEKRGRKEKNNNNKHYI